LNECAIENKDGKKSLNLLKKRGASEASNGALGAIFLMFSNYKIFLDNDTDAISKETLGTQLDTLCVASKDTAVFTESISSTSRGTAASKAPATTASAAVAKAVAPVVKLSDKYLFLKSGYTPSAASSAEPAVVVAASTTSTSESDPEGFGGNATSGGRRKFNLKELMNNHKSKPKTHRNNSFKNKKSRVFYNRTKKNV